MWIFSQKNQISWTDYKHQQHQHRPQQGTVYSWLGGTKLNKRCTDFSRILEFLQTICRMIFTAYKTAYKVHKKKAVQHKIWKEMSQIPLVWMDQRVLKSLWGPKTCVYHGTSVSLLQCKAGDVSRDRLFRFHNSRHVLLDGQWHA